MLQDILIYGPVRYNDRCISKPISVNNVGTGLCNEKPPPRKEDICSHFRANDHFRSITYFFIKTLNKFAGDLFPHPLYF